MKPRAAPLLLFAASCASAADAPRAIVTRDTTVMHGGAPVSVRIVENPALPGDTTSWRLEAAPVVDIGGDAGPSGAPVYDVAGALRLSDGRIVVADGGTMTLRVFGAGGDELDSFGGAGEGPGEFRRITFFGLLPADSILVADIGLARITVFSPDGALAREARFGDRAESPPSSVMGLFADGTLLSRGFVYPGDPPPRGVFRPRTDFFHLDADGALLDSLSAWPSGELYFAPAGDGLVIEDARFPLKASFHAGGNRFLVETTDGYEVLVFDETGVPLLRIRRAWEPRPVHAADVEAERRARIDALSSDADPATFERMLAEMPVPDVLPPIDNVITDDDGNVWVRDYRTIYEEGDATWSVFDADGRIIARAVTPGGLEPERIGRSWVLGVWKDALDVEHVRLYRLRKDG